MIAATLTVPTSAASILSLIEAATAEQLGPLFSGRVAEVHIQWLSGSVHHVYKPGTVVVATDSGFEFADPATEPHKGLLVLRGAAGMNVISLAHIYLVSVVAGSVRVTAYVI